MSGSLLLRHVAIGLGKTFIGSEKMKSLGAKANLIVCQKSKIDDWLRHIEICYPNEYAGIIDLTKKKGFDQLSFAIANDHSFVAVINYDLLWRRKELLKLENFTLLLDESSLIQNTSAQRTKFTLKLRPVNVILLSGTPVGGKYENLWSQLHLLGWNIPEATYNAQYVNWVRAGEGVLAYWMVDRDNPYKDTDRLKRKMREHGAVFKKTEEVITLPEQNFVERRISSSKEYWRFIKDGIVDVGCETLVGDTPLTKLLRARQLCGMYSLPKLTEFRTILESTNDRLIVFYNFTDELYALKSICADLDRPVSEVNGHTKDLTAYETESNSVTFCQYQSGAKGLNLQKANKVVYFTLPLSSEDFEQSKKRIHRIGQTNVCFYFILLCKGTVDEHILLTLEQKKDFTDKLFEEDIRDDI